MEPQLLTVAEGVYAWIGVGGDSNAGAVENEVSTVWSQILTGSTTPAAGMKTMQDTCTQLMAQKV